MEGSLGASARTGNQVEADGVIPRYRNIECKNVFVLEARWYHGYVLIRPKQCKLFRVFYLREISKVLSFENYLETGFYK